MKSLTDKMRLAGVIVRSAMVCMGVSFMDRYENTPGPVQTSPAQWPRGTSLALSPSRVTLLIFVHPQCPCTTATLVELEKFLARKTNRMDAVVIAVVPRSHIKLWLQSALLKAATNIPGVRLYLDIGGVEARRFAAMTSGYSLAYTSDGRRRFAGGLTAARGEAGDSFGIETLAELGDSHPLLRTTTPVFGCELAGTRPGKW